MILQKLNSLSPTHSVGFPCSQGFCSISSALHMLLYMLVQYMRNLRWQSNTTVLAKIFLFCWHQVRQLQEDAARLQSAYAGDKADDIQRRENEVLEAWKALLDACEGRRVRLVDTGDKFRFFSMVRDLMLWMEDVIRQIEAQEKPR